ncbi:MAG TPA: hypothetical protein VJY35_10500 [Candidatus Eisenbacteria bacterium]|nr:hypothetical protein [Candidatus Eisenbacteria bacterium]
MRRTLLPGLLAGVVWGAIGLAITGQMLGPFVWAGVAAAPLIGALIAWAFRGWRSRAPASRIALALVSLYLASGLFALAVGIADAARLIPNRIPHAVVIQTVLGVWWGITFTFWLPVLWALAYATHALLGRADRR